MPSWRSRRFPTTATPAGPAPTTTAAHLRVVIFFEENENEMWM